ncbi:hypothetical protein ACW9HJ_30720 [Nocardia gipuzkoensis]
MALDIVVQDINHTELHRFGDDADETLFRLCAAQPDTSWVRGIYRYGHDAQAFPSCPYFVCHAEGTLNG